ncbi:MAG TPA: shikimate dehydrogenase [Dehalococcoidia bacterium]|jgi:shikimate dehydrogenase|nr:shikimate dehydrogenase [Dehalococcoidia bacterium]
MLKYLGVIGYPLERSLSPVFQQAALDHLRLDMVYEAWPTPPDGLRTRVGGLRGESALGANVTIPHKEAVLPMMDEVDEIAARVGAVNTIVNRERRLSGYNTDVVGFMRALREDGGFEPAGKRVVVAGAGGAARAVVVALLEAEVASIAVINRTLSRANRLVEALRAYAGNGELRSLPEMYASWAAVMGACDLLINCTAAGSVGFEEESVIPADLIRPGMLVYDLVYHPAETALMASACKRKASVLGGLPMLVYQGAASFELWTGREAPLDVMFEAARGALGEGEMKAKV